MLDKLYEKLLSIEEGYTEVLYRNQKYGLSKLTFNNGKSIKIYAKQLAGNDFISLNYYKTKQSNHLKPCEMETQKILDFLFNFN